MRQHLEPPRVYGGRGACPWIEAAALPLDTINAASAREKSIRHGNPSTLHLWWARRPLAAAHAVDPHIAIATHPAYQRIIGLGPQAIPLILAEMQREPRHWFWALAALTGENPVSLADQGRVPEMTAAWLMWGRENGWIE